jgi:membrane-bound metal-dependent hydrolase YbcI (DUF457 family)
MVIVVLPLAGILFLLGLFLTVLGFTKRWFVAGSTTLGAVGGAVVGFWIGEAYGPPPPPDLYVIGPSKWAFYGGFLGLLVGSVLGATVSAGVVRRRRVKRRGVARLQGRPE